MSIWDFFELSPEKQLWALTWIMLMTLPFIAIAILLRKKIKVGKINIEGFLLYYGVFLIILSLILDAFHIDFLLVFGRFGGIFIGIILMFVVFNKVSEGVLKTFIITFTIEERDLIVEFCYVYEYYGHRCKITLDPEGHESFWSFIRRLLGKRTFLRCEGAQWEWTERKVNLAYLCTTYEHTNDYLDINGKQVWSHIIDVVPIPATELSVIQFLFKYKSFQILTKKLATSQEEKMRLETDIYSLAFDLYTTWANETEKGQWGENRLTTREYLKQWYEKQDKNMKKTTRQRPPEESEEEGEEALSEVE